MTDTLEQCGFIKKEYVQTEKSFKVNTYYSLCSYEEWKSKQPSINKRLIKEQ